MRVLLLRTVLLTTCFKGSYYFRKQRILSLWLVVCNLSFYPKILWNIWRIFMVLYRNSKLWDWWLILTRITYDYASDGMSVKMLPTFIAINRPVVKTIICSDHTCQSNLWFKVWCWIQRPDKLALFYFSYFCFLQGAKSLWEWEVALPRSLAAYVSRNHKYMDLVLQIRDWTRGFTLHFSKSEKQEAKARCWAVCHTTPPPPPHFFYYKLWILP